MKTSPIIICPNLQGYLSHTDIYLPTFKECLLFFGAILSHKLKEFNQMLT